MAHVELSEKNPYYISKHRYYELNFTSYRNWNVFC